MKKLAFIYIILAGITWGTSGIFVNFLAPYGFTSPQMTAIRSTVTFVGIGCFLLIRDRSAFRAGFKELLLFIGSGVAFFGTATSYYAALQATSISTAVVLLYTAPVMVMIYSVIFLGEKLTKLKCISVAIMLIGCGLVSGVIGGLKFNLIGILLGFLSGVLYSAYNILTKLQMRKGCKPISATFYTFLFSALSSLTLFSPAELVKNATAEPFVTVPLMLGLGLVTCVIPYILYTCALKVLPAGTSSALAIMEPMSATLFSIIIFHEKLSLPSASGMILILLAVLLLSRADEGEKDG
ncbi:MAG: EamA family transporter [Clostridia bacterium]|nr:EamA family transporter [Clostridia bacterium]